MPLTASGGLAPVTSTRLFRHTYWGLLQVGEKLYYTGPEIASIFGLTDSYLRKLRQFQAGPVFVKIGRMIRYRVADVQRWIDTVAVEVTPKRAS